MKILGKLKILTTLLLVLFFACNNSKFSNKEIETRALEITNKLDKPRIKILRKWNFGFRGKAEVWSKTINDSTLYSCMYIKSNDTISIGLSKRYLYSNEFPVKIKIDTSKYWRFQFKRSNDQKIKIIGVDNNGKDRIIAFDQTQDNIFEKNSPFKKMDSLSKLKDYLGVIGISHISRIGDFIQFYITEQNVLTYIPDYSNLNPKHKDIWIKKFSKGKNIKEKWNLRKLDKPLDNG